MKYLSAMLAMLLLVMTVSAQDETPMPPVEPTDVSLDAVLDDPESFYGSMVNVEGDLVEAVATNAFLFQDDDLIITEQILVVFDSGELENFNLDQLGDEDIRVTVVGEVVAFARDEVADTLDDDYDVNLFDAYDGDNFIIADSVTLVETPDQQELTITIGDIQDEPEFYLDEIVTLEGELTDIYSVNTAVIDDGDPMLVVYDLTQFDDFNIVELLEEDVQVLVEGTVQMFSVDDPTMVLLDDVDLDAQDDLEMFNGTPAVVAETMTVVSDLPEDLETTTDTMVEYPDFYVNTNVMVRGEAVEAVSSNAFLLNTEGENIIVVYNPEDLSDPIADITEEDVEVEVQGIAQYFEREAYEEEFDIDMDVELFDDYEDQISINATDVRIVEETEIDEFTSIDSILDDPELYYGQTVTVQQVITEVVSIEAFVLQYDELFDEDRLLVIFDTETYADLPIIQLAEDETEVRVTGTVREFVRSDLQTEFDFDLEDDIFDDFEDRAALVAEEIIVIEDEE